jgi:hypothetical protein
MIAQFAIESVGADHEIRPVPLTAPFNVIWRKHMFSGFVAGLLIVTAQFAIVGADGQPAEVWDSSAVLYAKVLSVEQRGPHTYLICLKPLATLTGEFDSAYRGDVLIGPAIGSREFTDIEVVPAIGAKVVVLIDRSGQPIYTVRNGRAQFFPKNERGNAPCLFEVTGFDDPKVTETIENLRKLRGKQREEAEQKAVAEKKGK